jgi:polar amino acid transport system substrate-binding protein
MHAAWLLLLMLAASAARAAEVEIVTGDIPPYTFRETEDGPAKGVVVELVQAMARLVGHSGKMTFLPWKRAVAVAEHGKDGAPVLIIPLNRSPEREPLFSWVTPLLKDDTVLVTKEGGKPRIDAPQSAIDYTVGVLLGSPLERELRDKGFKHVDVGVDEETNAKKLRLGRVDAWLVAAMVAPFVYGRLGYPTTELRYGATLRVNDLHLGATKTLPEPEAAKWRDAMAKLTKSGEVDRILKAYRR